MAYNKANRQRNAFLEPMKRVIFDALNKSIKTAISLLDEQGESSVNAIKKDYIEQAYIELYQKVGLFFAKQTESSLTKDITVDDIYMAKLERWVLNNAGERITEVWLYTKEQYINVIREATGTAVDMGLGAPQTARMIRNMVEDRMGEIALYRAERIARTEIVSASNMGSLEGAVNSQASVKKRWLTSGLAGVRPTHMDAELQGAIDLNQTFTVGNDQLQYPGDVNGSPEEVINCRCTIIYERV